VDRGHFTGLVVCRITNQLLARRGVDFIFTLRQRRAPAA
jgi:hypothetical protein